MINNYNNSKIYALRSDDTDKIYIGTTTQNLSKKLSELRTSNSNLISEYFRKYGDVYIELIEYYPCKSKEELNKRQGELVRENISIVVNRQMRKINFEFEKRKAQEKTLYFLRKGKPDDMTTEEFEKIKNDYINSLCKKHREAIL